jgi:hypothetical protein
VRTFPKIALSPNTVAHYIDDYRNADFNLIICKHSNNQISKNAKNFYDAEISRTCKRCIAKADNYPTKEEFFAYHQCTDCGIDLWWKGQSCYKIINKVWKTAYPNYLKNNKPSRPCFTCLEKRINKPLQESDFVYIW